MSAPTDKSDIDRAIQAAIEKHRIPGMRQQVVDLLAKYDAKKVPELRYKDLAAFTRECEALTPPEPTHPSAWAIGSALDDAKAARVRDGAEFGACFKADTRELVEALYKHGFSIVETCTQPAPSPIPTPKFAIGEAVKHMNSRTYPPARGEWKVAGYELRYILQRGDGTPYANAYGIHAEKLERLPPAPRAPAPVVPKFQVGDQVKTPDGVVATVGGLRISYQVSDGRTWSESFLQPVDWL